LGSALVVAYRLAPASQRVAAAALSRGKETAWATEPVLGWM
jgi:hypothetical protein